MEEKEILVEELINFDNNDYEVWDEEKKCWVDINNSCYIKDGGFPNITEATKPILSITVYCQEKKKYHVFAYKKLTRELNYNYEYHLFENETDMLVEFVQFFRNNFPDILIGWNSDSFDIPYLVNRIFNLHGEIVVEKLSPFDIIEIRELKFEDDLIFILGTNSFDYMKLYKKYVYESQESYSLNNIAKVELGKEKVDYHGEYKTLDELYEKDFDRFIEYNMKDVELVVQLEDKMKFVDLHMTISYIAKIPFEDAYKTLQTWDGLIYNYVIKDNIIVPPIKKPENEDEFGGAYVMEPEKGMHNWVMNFDINSLYPNLIISHNISPDTLISVGKKQGNDELFINKEANLEVLKSNNTSYTANGCYFSREKQGIIPQIMSMLYNNRVDFKKRMKTEPELKDKYDNMQYAFKILLNSGYGALGNRYFRFYNINLAEAVTTMGRILIQMIGKNIEENFNNNIGKYKYWIYSDTDSIYVKFDSMVNKRFQDELFNIKDKKVLIDNKRIIEFLGIADEQVQAIIRKTIRDYCDYFNTYKNTLVMSREKICDRVIFVAKKKYILRTVDDEGKYYEDGKISVKGIEIVRKDTPEVIREKIKDTVKFILDNPDNVKLKNYIEKYYEEFKKEPVYNIARPKSVNKVEVYTDINGDYKRGKKGTGCPIQSRASILYNKLVKKFDIESKYRLIRDKDKIRFVYLKMPNPIMENVIGFLNEDELPIEFGLENFIDYKTQFEKVFKKPILNIIESMKWDLSERKESVLDFF